jgi:hypothetical protein
MKLHNSETQETLGVVGLFLVRLVLFLRLVGWMMVVDERDLSEKQGSSEKRSIETTSSFAESRQYAVGFW